MTDLPQDVKLARQGDAPLLLELLRIKHQEDAVASFNEDLVLEKITSGIDQRDGLIGIIRAADGAIEATSGLFVERVFWYSPDEVVNERWSIVAPSCRRSEHAKHLVQFARWGSEQLAKPLLVSHIENDATAAKGRLLHRNFVTPSGFLFFSRPTTLEVVAPGV